jgi:hypothetical protein
MGIDKRTANIPEVTPLSELGGDGSAIRVTPTHYNDAGHDIVTANFQFYYQQHGEDPIQQTCVFSDYCPPSNEEPYGRRINVTEDGVLLDLGWLKGKPIGVVLIENRSGKNRVKPTEEELEDQKKQIIVVTDGDGPGFKIRPGRFAFVEPVDATTLRLTSLHGTVKAHVLVCPDGDK